MIDISSMKTPGIGGAKFGLLILDECTDMCWSIFLKQKSDLGLEMMRFINNMRGNHGKKIATFIRCDNAGENKKFQELAEKNGLGIHFEFTAPDTPQQNGKIERKFATLYGRVRSMLNEARLPSQLRKGLWAEAARTASMISNILVTDNNPVPPHKLFYGSNARLTKNTRIFGEIGIVANVQQQFQSKMTNVETLACFWVILQIMKWMYFVSMT